MSKSSGGNLGWTSSFALGKVWTVLRAYVGHRTNTDTNLACNVGSRVASIKQREDITDSSCRELFYDDGGTESRGVSTAFCSE